MPWGGPCLGALFKICGATTSLSTFLLQVGHPNLHSGKQQFCTSSFLFLWPAVDRDTHAYGFTLSTSCPTTLSLSCVYVHVITILPLLPPFPPSRLCLPPREEIYLCFSTNNPFNPCLELSASLQSLLCVLSVSGGPCLILCQGGLVVLWWIYLCVVEGGQLKGEEEGGLPSPTNHHHHHYTWAFLLNF